MSDGKEMEETALRLTYGARNGVSRPRVRRTREKGRAAWAYFLADKQVPRKRRRTGACNGGGGFFVREETAATHAALVRRRGKLKLGLLGRRRMEEESWACCRGLALGLGYGGLGQLARKLLLHYVLHVINDLAQEHALLCLQLD